MKLKRDLVLVVREEAPKKISGLTSVVNSPLFRGKVFTVGPDVKDIKVGANVIFNQYGFTEHIIDGVTYLAMKEEEIIIELE